MKNLGRLIRIFTITLVITCFIAEEAEARRKRRRRSRSKLYSAPTKFSIQDRKASIEIKKDKLILTSPERRVEEPLPFQTKQDKVAGMSYIPLGGRHFIQMVVWVVDVKGNRGPGVAPLDAPIDASGEDIGQSLYWELYEIIGQKIIWRHQQVLDQFVGKMDQELPPHMENAIQLAVDESGRVYFRRGAVEELIAAD